MSMTMCDRPLVAMVNMGDIYNNVILHAQINILWSFSHQRVADGSEGLSAWGLETGKCYSRAVFCRNFLKNSPNVHLHSPYTCAESRTSPVDPFRDHVSIVYDIQCGRFTLMPLCAEGPVSYRQQHDHLAVRQQWSPGYPWTVPACQEPNLIHGFGCIFTTAWWC